MDIRRGIRYVLAVDVLESGFENEAALYRENLKDPHTSQPSDLPARARLELYGTQAWNHSLRYVGALALRYTGIDAVVRLMTSTEFPK